MTFWTLGFRERSRNSEWARRRRRRHDSRERDIFETRDPPKSGIISRTRTDDDNDNDETPKIDPDFLASKLPLRRISSSLQKLIESFQGRTTLLLTTIDGTHLGTRENSPQGEVSLYGLVSIALKLENTENT